jgi:hypothetical protein
MAFSNVPGPSFSVLQEPWRSFPDLVENHKGHPHIGINMRVSLIARNQYAGVPYRPPLSPHQSLAHREQMISSMLISRTLRGIECGGVKHFCRNVGLVFLAVVPMRDDLSYCVTDHPGAMPRMVIIN